MNRANGWRTEGYLLSLVCGLWSAVSLSPAQADTHYVDIASTNPIPPYTNWSKAATVIQGAIDASDNGDTVLVTNGVYSNGGRAVWSNMLNRVVINKSISVCSVNGPAWTSIVGAGVGAGNTNGDGAIRCVYMSGDAVLSGFTLTNGRTLAIGDEQNVRSGGGVWCGSSAAIITNCVLTANSASYYGGGAYCGTLNNCNITSNSGPRGGGVYNGILNNCTLSTNSAVFGGGSHISTLSNCTLTANFATDYGGGAYDYGPEGTFRGALYNCTLIANAANYGGGGAMYVMLSNCTLTANSAASGGGVNGSTLYNCILNANSASSGGGAIHSTLNNCTLTANSAASGGGGNKSTLNNCILWYNTALIGPNYSTGTFNYCCTTPLPAGIGNISEDPLLASVSHLSVNSPCIGKGSSIYAAGTDIDDESWNTPPSMGCDEYRSGGVTGALTVAIRAAYTQVVTGCSVDFTGLIEGRVSNSRWNLGDGTIVSNRPYISHAWVIPGVWQVILNAFNETYSGGISATVTVHVVSQSVYYVATNSPSPVPPFSSWATAATNIQDAVDAVNFLGSVILVSNGVYDTGGWAVSSNIANRVVINKPVIVRSVNGPAWTSIVGKGVGAENTNGDGAVRCVLMTNNAVLIGFTLTNGHTRSSGDQVKDRSGGGVWCSSKSVNISNCVLVANSASYYAGGAYSGTLIDCTLIANSAYLGGGTDDSALSNCILVANSAYSGGGAYGGTLNNCILTANTANEYRGGGVSYGTLNNCTLTANSAYSGGGAYGGTLNNCILWYNTSLIGSNYLDGTLNYCCTTPLPTGTGNISEDPLLASGSHLSEHSPCIRKGRGEYVTGTDIDGELWNTPPSIGCDEYRNSGVTGALTVAIRAKYTQVAVGYSVDFTGLIEGRTSNSRWNFGDGTIISNRPYISHAWATTGVWAVVFTAFNEANPSGVSTTVSVRVVTQPIHFVVKNNPFVASPYTSWATAATNVQDAVDAVSVIGALVLVTNGVYNTGGRSVWGSTTNRVVIDKPITVKSVNGPAWTAIVGRGVGLSNTNGNGAIRCVYMTDGVLLSGFTLTNGHTCASGDWMDNMSGGGVWCSSPAAIISNCVIVANSAAAFGGGSYKGTLSDCALIANAGDRGGGSQCGVLNNCTLTANLATDGGGTDGCMLNNCALTANSAASGGGANDSTLNNCVLISNSANRYGGGGANNSTLNNCTLTANSTSGSGGGAAGGELNNCTLTANSANGAAGGGACYSTLNNCTLTGNSAADGGGTYSGMLNNCIIWKNSALTCPNYSGGTLNYCCTTPLANGTGNINSDPLLASTSHLSEHSPCIGRGSSKYATGVDVDGESWTSPPSIGCDEYLPGSVTGALSVSIRASYMEVAVGYAVDFTGLISGRTSNSRWNLGDGSMIDNQPYVSHAWTTTGVWAVVFTAFNETHPSGVSTTVSVRVVTQPIHFVVTNNPFVMFPYTSWGTAATNVQDAVDAVSVIGALVLVSNGVYNTGGRSVWGSTTNRVVIDKPITVKSVNGPAWTAIVGRGVGLSNTNGDNAIRCVYMTNGVFLSGFTITNGHTQISGDTSGGGIWCASTDSTISNCHIVGNSASYGGGGTYQGTLNSCSLLSNSAYWGGGAYRSLLNKCFLSANFGYYGGGTDSARLESCILTSNVARYYGGGANDSTLSNCTLTANSTEMYDGGGASGGALNDCTISANIAKRRAGGSDSGILNNCILVANSSIQQGGGAYNGTLNSCTLTSNSASLSGGGASFCSLTRCTLTANSTVTYGGGADGGTLSNCTLTANVAFQYGGGASAGKLNNCTIVSNSAAQYGGGVSASTLNNSVVWNNSAPSFPNYYGGTLNYCCAWPLSIGEHNIAAAPQFVDVSVANLRLQPLSPCINNGMNQDWMYSEVDLAGNPRIRNGTVDMGAYEFVFSVDLKGFLQGPYRTNTHAMTTSLRTNVPLVSPNAAGTRQVKAIPTNVVDWALLEVQDTNGNSVAATSVFLDQQGRVRDETGSNGIPLEASAGTYNLVLKHRNHLAVMSAQPVAFTNTDISYDFTTNSTQYYGGTNSCVQLESNVWGMIAGDADGDGKITAVDRQIVTQQMGRIGYLPGDINLDGIVTEGDIP